MNSCGKRENLHELGFFPASLLFIIFPQWEITVMLQKFRESHDLKSVMTFLYVYLKTSFPEFPGTILMYFSNSVYYLTVPYCAEQSFPKYFQWYTKS